MYILALIVAVAGPVGIGLLFVKGKSANWVGIACFFAVFVALGFMGSMDAATW